MTCTLDKAACRSGEPYQALLGAAPLGVLGYSACQCNKARKGQVHDDNMFNGSLLFVVKLPRHNSTAEKPTPDASMDLEMWSHKRSQGC